jgi:hypothetical protein
MLIFANIHALGLQVLPCLQYLSLELRVRIWHIVERKDAPAKFEEKVCAEGNEGPERNLVHGQQCNYPLSPENLHMGQPPSEWSRGTQRPPCIPQGTSTLC